MSSEWQLSTVGDFCPFKYGKGLPERDRKPGAYGVYSSAGLVGWHDSAYVNASGIVVGRKGTVGSVTFSAKPFWPIDTAFYVDDQPRIRDIHFTYYLLKTLDLHLMNTDSAVPGLNRDNAHAIEVRIPPLSVQRDIANFLRLMDDRITLLRETNTTLEQIAQALFKSWFVNFDPVRAKSVGKLPEGMDEATASLFPDAFEETELGMVPRSWQVSTLSSLATFQNGYAFKGSDWVEQGHPVIKIGNVKPLLIDFEGCSYVSPETVSVLDRFKLGRGDLLVGMTGYVGETGLVTSTEVASYLNQRVGRIVTSQGLDDLGFVFATVRQAEFKAYAESQSHGSAQANVSGADLMKFAVVIPSAQVLNIFNQLVGKLIEKILANFEQAKTLTNLRDTLLPRLISGQLRIADAEAELERVTA